MYDGHNTCIMLCSAHVRRTSVGKQGLDTQPFPDFLMSLPTRPEGLRRKLRIEVAALQKQLAELAASQAEMDKLRREENAAFVKNKADMARGPCMGHFIFTV